jgi:hypothetical protein
MRNKMTEYKNAIGTDLRVIIVSISTLIMIVVGVVFSFSEEKEDDEEPFVHLPYKAPEDPSESQTESAPKQLNGPLNVQFETAAEVTHSPYSPGNKSWAPTEDDRSEWKKTKWEESILEWAQPKLATWSCRSCKDNFGSNSRFVATEGDSHVFKHKCKCGHDHTVKLKHGN